MDSAPLPHDPAIPPGDLVQDEILRRLGRPLVFAAPELVTAPPSWLGHIPFAFWIVEALRPQTLVELGAHTGNSYSAFCQAVKRLGLPARCYAVDTWQGDPQAGFYGDEVYATLAAFHDPRYGAFSRLLRETFDEAAIHFADGSIDLLHIDGLHTYEAVRHDFETWRAKLGPRGVVLFHDVNVRHGDFGVWKLWDEVTREYPHFTFLHSNGLGVLGVGKDLPEPVRWLFEAAAGPGLAAIRTFFDRLGGGVIHQQEATRLEGEKSALLRDVAGLHATIDERLAEIRSLMGTVAERDRDIAIIQGWNAEHQAALQAAAIRHQATIETMTADYQATLHALHETLGQRETRIAGLEEGLAALTAERQAERAHQAAHAAALEQIIAQRDHQLLALYTSTSWKVSAPVRRLGRLFNRLRRLYRAGTHRMTLAPFKDVTASAAGGFESTGSDPAFLLSSDRGRLPTDWCEISYRVTETTVPLSATLYLDTGHGFGEGETVALAPTCTAGTVSGVVLLPPTLRAVRFDPADRPGRFRIEDFTIREIGKLQLLTLAFQRSRGQLRDRLYTLRRFGPAALKESLLRDLRPDGAWQTYENWVALYDTLSEADRQAIAADIAALERRPLISVVMPVYNTPEPYLIRALDTVRAQLYPHWELCIADDASPQPHVARVLARYQEMDSRIKVMRRPTNGHISAASNSALELATGEFVALMDHDDELPPHALYRVAVEINRHPDLDILYSDEDKIDENGRRHDPYFKSDWNPDRLTGQNMVSHLGVYRRSLLTEIGNFRVGYEGSQDYDLVLRAADHSHPSRIRHVPMILYHWRVFSHSSSFSTIALGTATDAARRALGDHFARRGVAATVGPAPGAEGYSRITYALPETRPLVSLIVPTRDKLELLRPCVEGLLHQTAWREVEVLVLDNNSEQPETLEYLTTLPQREGERARVLHYAGPFNYSAINNYAVRHARGSLIGLINNDIQVIEPGWLDEMASHALRPEVGAVGAKLYYGDDTIQHAGVVTGINGVANHVYKHLPRNHPGYFGGLRLVQNFSCVTAACLVMRKAVFEEVGGLDEKDLKVAFNDVDLCLRIRDAGYLLVWTPHAELYHLESASRGSDAAPDKVERARGEVRAMGERWGESLIRDPFYNPNLTLDACDYGLAFPPRVEKPWLKRE